MLSPVLALDHAGETVFKIVILGDSGAGKTALVAQYVSRIFSDVDAPTIGVDFSTKRLNVSGATVRLTLWDTAGQERFRTLTSSYYRGAHGVVLVFDVGERSTFVSVHTWLEELAIYANRQHLAMLLVGTKTDAGNREVSFEEGVALAENEAMAYAETSAKTREGVDEAFGKLVTRLFSSPHVMQSAVRTGHASAWPVHHLGNVDAVHVAEGSCASC